MSDSAGTQLVPVEQVEKLIHLARGEKVLLDSDLATLYGVTTGNLNKAVKRNQQRFPSDFMFQLSDEEAAGLIFQSGISKQRGGRRRSLPYAFTEQGVAMMTLHIRQEVAGYFGGWPKWLNDLGHETGMALPTKRTFC